MMRRTVKYFSRSAYWAGSLLERVRSAVNGAFIEMFGDQHHADWETVARAARHRHRRVVGNIDGQELINLRLTSAEMPFRFALFLLGTGAASEPKKA